MTVDEMIEVLQAHKEGKTIQFLENSFKDIWMDCTWPCFSFSTTKYRVKSEEPDSINGFYYS